MVCEKKYDSDPTFMAIGFVLGGVIGLAPVESISRAWTNFANKPSIFGKLQNLVKALQEGDPIFWTLACLFLLCVLVVIIVWIKTSLDFKREEKRKKRKLRGKPE